MHHCLKTFIFILAGVLLAVLPGEVSAQNMEKTEKNREKAMFRTGILLSVIGFLLMGLANDSNLAVSPLFWCILGMGIAMETETFHS